MKNETAITKASIISQLAKSPHGDLKQYVPIGLPAVKQEPEFFSHLTAWNSIKGQVRDSKVALPVLALSVKGFDDPEFVENALANLALLPPRDLLRGYKFYGEIREKGPGNHRSAFRNMLKRTIRFWEEHKFLWDKKAIQDRQTVRDFYCVTQTKPAPWAKSILFDGEYPPGSVFEQVHNLYRMSAEEAAAVIIKNRLPWLTLRGALREKVKDPALVRVIIERMTPTELVSNMTLLEKMGLKTDPVLRAAYQEALKKAGGSRSNTFKTTKAAAAVEDEEIAENLRGLQEKQIKSTGGIDGSWAVLADKSGSMSACIEASRHVAATLSKMVKGNVHLIFFNELPQYFDVTGKDYDAILKETRRVQAGGQTSVGVGVQYLMGLNGQTIEVDGFAIVSDMYENHAPYFVDRYKRYCEITGKEPPIYLYSYGPKVMNDLRSSLTVAGLEYTEFELWNNKTDYYSIPNLAQTMKVNRYGLVDEIMEQPLLLLNDVFKIRGKTGAASN